MKYFSVLFVLVCMSLPVSGRLHAQGGLLPSGNAPRTGSFSSTGGAYYNFSGGTGCDFLISIWGSVGNPGRYYVPCETNLLDLLSYCGGPNRGAYLDKVKIIRRGGVDRQNEIDQVFEINVEKYLNLTTTSKPASELLLFPRDLVIIDGSVETESIDWVLRIAQIIVALGTAITTVVAVINLTKD